MPGFFVTDDVTFSKKISYNNEKGYFLFDSLQNDNLIIQRNTLNKYLNDKLFYQDDTLIIILEGVITNCKALLEKYTVATLLELTKKRAFEDEIFFNEFRGTFSGGIYYKSKNKWIFFVDHFSTKGLYYYEKDGTFVVGSQLKYVTDYLKEKNITVNSDITAFQYFLTYGFMLDNRTIVSGVKRVFPGSYIIVNDNTITEKEYFVFENTENENLSDQDCIDLLDKTFVKGLEDILEKDKEYGYNTLVDISGGYDCRLISYVAKELGYTNITNLCYSQINSSEKRTTDLLVRDLKNEYYFKSMDDAKFLFEIEEILTMNNAACYYAGITGGKQFFDTLNCARFGFEVTGILGDIRDGSFSYKPYNEKVNVNGKNYRFSNILNYNFNGKISKSYKNNEMFYFYTRGLLGGMSTFFTRQHYFESISPYANVEFMQAMLTIPLRKRITGRIMYKWVLDKHPEVNNIPHAGTGLYMDTNDFYRFITRKRNALFRKIIKVFNKNSQEDSMNPFDYWYRTNSDFSTFIREYWESNKNCIQDVEIYTDCEKLFNEGRVLDKLIVLSVVGSYKVYLG